MSTQTAGQVINTALQRARDPDALRTTRTRMLDYVQRAQEVVDTFTKSAIDSTAFTTNPFQLLYQRSSTTLTLMILGIRDGTRSLNFIPWKTLVEGDPEWFRRVGEDFEAFSMVGANLIVVYPAKSVASSVNAIGVKRQSFASESDVLGIDDDKMVIVLDILNAVLLLKSRDLSEAKLAVDRVRAWSGLPI